MTLITDLMCDILCITLFQEDYDEYIYAFSAYSDMHGITNVNKLHQSYCKCKDALHYLGNNAVFKILEAFSGPIAPQKCATKRCWQAKFILSVCVPLCLQCYFRGTERHMQMHRVHEHMYAQA